MWVDGGGYEVQTFSFQLHVVPEVGAFLPHIQSEM